jgi:hypothetical protein
MRRLAGLALLLCVLAPAAHAAPPRPVAPLARPRLLRMPAPLRADSPTWVGSQGKVAFLGNRTAGEPADVFLWDPVARQMGRGTETSLVRHSLVSSPDGRLAYVERDPSGVVAVSDGTYREGPDRVVVYDYAKGTRTPVFEGGYVQQGSLCWSQGANRLAFILQDAADTPQLALLESGKPLAVTRLPLKGFVLTGIVGWMDAREVMTTATAPNGAEVLLRVGAAGFNVLAPGLKPRLSFDGRYLLTRASSSLGVMLRGTASGGRTLHQTASAYGWGPGNRVYVVVGPDVLALDLKGSVVRQYPNVIAGAIDNVVVAPDGKYAVLQAGRELSVLVL